MESKNVKIQSRVPTPITTLSTEYKCYVTNINMTLHSRKKSCVQIYTMIVFLRGYIFAHLSVYCSTACTGHYWYTFAKKEHDHAITLMLLLCRLFSYNFNTRIFYLGHIITEVQIHFMKQIIIVQGELYEYELPQSTIELILYLLIITPTIIT